MTGVLDVLLASGMVLKIPHNAQIGGFAIHPCVRDNRADGPAWTVTHISTGKLVWCTLEHAVALKIARWLDEQRIIPVGLEQTKVWRQKLTEHNRVVLIEQLSDLGPRYWP